MRKKIVLGSVVLVVVASIGVGAIYFNKEKPTQTIPEENTCEFNHEGYDYASLDYELVWNDEFDYNGEPNPNKWGYDLGSQNGGWGNNELQYYTKENASVENGFLTIEAKKESVGNFNYTSSRMVTKNKGDWKYGRIETRAIMPSGKGTWAAIWMLPTEWKYGAWPLSGEIDIMEYVGFDAGVAHQTIHTKRYNGMEGTQIGRSYPILDIEIKFHTYAIEWLPDKLVFYIDDEVKYTYEPQKMITCPTYKEWPYDQKFHLLLNIAVGGNWGGAQGVDDSIWPQKMIVDYVRVYQAKQFSE